MGAKRAQRHLSAFTPALTYSRSISFDFMLAPGRGFVKRDGQKPLQCPKNTRPILVKYRFSGPGLYFFSGLCHNDSGE